MGKLNMVTVTFEIGKDALAEAEKVLEMQGLSLESALEVFFYWCARYPEEAATVIRSWMSETEMDEKG